MPRRARQLLCAVLMLAAVVSGGAARQAPEVNRRFRTAVPNLHAPELYARFIRARITLADLPGAGDPESSWEMTYRLYHVPEEGFIRALTARRDGAWNPAGSDFPGHVLLGEGRFLRGPLSEPQQRTFVSPPIPFKSKVAGKNRTKFAHLLLTYSLKVSDARLRSTIYHSGAFFYDPFETRGGGDEARTTCHLSFLVTPQGRLNSSILPEHANANAWR